MIVMDTLTQIVAGSVAIFLILALTFINIRLLFSRKKIANLLLQEILDKMVLQDSLDKLSEEHGALSIQGSDGFVKFLSQSREWAFGYIEEVQQSIVELDVAMNSLEEEKISSAYKKLLEHLPKTDNEK